MKARNSVLSDDS